MHSVHFLEVDGVFLCPLLLLLGESSHYGFDFAASPPLPSQKVVYTKIPNHPHLILALSLQEERTAFVTRHYMAERRLESTVLPNFALFQLD